MGLFKFLGGVVGEGAGRQIGRHVGQQEASQMLIPWFGRADRLVQRRENEYAQQGRTVGQNIGKGVDTVRRGYNVYNGYFGE